MPVAPVEASATTDAAPARPAAAGRRWRRGWAWTVALTLPLAVLVAAPPFVGPSARAVVMAGFSGLCHQMPGRSFHMGGIALAVCERCTGIYLGLTLAALAFPLLRRRVRVRRAPLALAASLAPAGLDWLAGVAGWWEGSPGLRLATGLVFGLVAGALLAAAAGEAASGSARGA